MPSILALVDERSIATKGVPYGDASPLATWPILRYFEYGHLPAFLQPTSEMFAKLAAAIVVDLPDGEEKDVALRKILEAKDAAVRAALDLPR